MTIQSGGPCLKGQTVVHAAWAARLHGRDHISKNELDLSEIIGELAHVSLLQREGGGYRFRLAGTGVRNELDQEVGGKLVEDVPECIGSPAWSEGLERAMRDARPVMGRTQTDDDRVHFWMRLPMSSDGRRVDLVLCHDRYLPLEAVADPDRAARDADRRLRLDTEALAPA